MTQWLQSVGRISGWTLFCLPLLAGNLRAELPQVSFGPVPTWVHEATWAVETNESASSKSAGTRRLLYEIQDRPKSSQEFVRVAELMENENGVQDSGSLRIGFEAEFQDLCLHRVVIVTIPFLDSRPLAVCSHFFEFVDNVGGIHLAHELQKGQTYEIVLTTGGGLWRYRLQDEVQVTGFLGQTPSLRFLGRKGQVSDRFGEKLSEVFVTEVVQELLANVSTPPCFILLAPDENQLGCCYTLYVEGEVQPDIAVRLDDFLMKNPHYAWCRKLGQLQPPRLFRINASGDETFIAHEMSVGKRTGDIKPCLLSLQDGWSNQFAGNYCALFHSRDHARDLHTI